MTAMTEYLLLRLYGPLASWGETAVGEMRHSAVHPSRSALLGLLGAALGMERNDDMAQAVLAQGYRFGIRLEATGSPLRDYHTIQVGKPDRKDRFRSRRQELIAANKVDTILSQREYRCDSVALVAIEALPQAPVNLPTLAEALRQPRFTLYLGRKSCPLAAPLMPQLVQAATLREALDSVSFPSLLGLLDKQPQQAWPGKRDRQLFNLRQKRYYWEDGMQAGMRPDFDTWRHDQPISRRRWQFSPRQEWVALEREEQA